MRNSGEPLASIEQEQKLGKKGTQWQSCISDMEQ